MKKVALALLATLSLVLMMALSAGIAAAGWDYEDCPPVSLNGGVHASDQAKVNWLNVEPGVSETSPATVGDNPGNKFGTK